MFQCFHQFVEAAERLDLGFFFHGEVFLGHAAQPLFRQLARGHAGGSALARGFQAFEHLAEHAIEPIEVALVLH